MAKTKVTYIKGNSAAQNDSEGNAVPPVGTFVHIRKPHTKGATLCGSPVLNPVITKKPKERKQKSGAYRSDLCGFCDRIQHGRDPVFDRNSENSSSRKPEDIGTRANTSFTQFGDWNRARTVA